MSTVESRNPITIKVPEGYVAVVTSVNMGTPDESHEVHFKKAPKMGWRGARFKGGEEYILAAVGCNKVCLVGLSTGNRYREPITVVDSLKITEAELQSIGAGDMVAI